MYKAKNNVNEKYSNLAYNFFMIVFYMDLGFFIIETIFVLLTDPAFFFSYTILGLCFFYTLQIITLFFELYMLWICFCFMVHVNNERIYLLKNNSRHIFSIGQ